MKSQIVKHFTVYAGLLCAISYSSCKKDAATIIQDNEKVNSDSLVAMAATTNYIVSTVVGRGELNYPYIPYPYLICSASDGSKYVSSNNDIFRIDPQGGYTKYFTYYNPTGIKAGAKGSIYFVGNRHEGDGSADSSTFVKLDWNKKLTILPVGERLRYIGDMAIGSDSSILIPDGENHRIIRYSKDGVTSVLAGKKDVRGFADGVGDKAHFTSPTLVKFGEDGNLWVVDGTAYNIGQSIRKVSLSGRVTTVFKLNPQFTNPHSIISFAVTRRDKNYNLTPYQNVFFFVRSFTKDRKIISNQLFHLSHNKVLTAITGDIPEDFNYQDGPAMQANFYLPIGLTVTPDGIYVADTGTAL
ncbi:hypothetical protein IM792_07435 [Mucilaginibacter sp. JRF]|uniref:hypothetical protein n=1 Tax=Mucilaginibacter sp. JRF TaxID=2780088 RepID=UPI001880BF95|nr:hypothetical protein [Mucilaginibacter sp. JRF]MBE9584274.1 hypothetical protein [Mucilaginibacter sp. JRF]